MTLTAGGGISVNVNVATRQHLLDKVSSALRTKSSFTVATLNLDHLVKLRSSASFRSAYLRHDYIVADGHPVVWLSRLAGEPVELAPGSELIDPLCAIAAQAGAPVALLGSTEIALARAAARLESRHPGLKIVARVSPKCDLDPEGEDAAAALDAVKVSGARLCFVALGAPKQEILATRGVRAVSSCGFVSVGAGLDFIAGTQRRAPRILCAFAMEWLWRMLSDPRRLVKRYASCAVLLPSLALYACMRRKTAGAPRPTQLQSKAISRI